MEDFIMEFLNTKVLKEYMGVALVGSYARGTNHQWSDVDLVFLCDTEKESEVTIYGQHYFTISYVTEASLTQYLKEPSLILNGLTAFQDMKIIYDPENHFKKFQELARAFQWSSVLREHAKHRAKMELISYVEEAQKALSGLKEQHHGKMLNGHFGLSYGMFQVIRLRDQIMIGSDNDFYDAVYHSLDDKDPVKELAPMAFNIKPGSLTDQLDAGLELFVHVSNSLMDFCSHEEKDYLMRMVQEIIVVI